MINKVEEWLQRGDLVVAFTTSFSWKLLCAILCFAILFRDVGGLSTFSSFSLSKISNHHHSQSREPSETTVVILFNKPENVLTSHVSGDSRSTVYDEVQSMKGFVSSNHRTSSPSPTASFQQATGIKSKLNAIGRLDADTSGLLLLTNDGGLVHHVTNPNAPTHINGAITKTYEALIMGHHNQETLSPLWDGVDIGSKYGGMTRPVDNLEILDHPTYKSTLVSLTISEGKNRQVRRMFHALGSGVMKLKRTKIGDHLTLDGLNVGEWRILSSDEVKKHLQWEPRKIEAYSKKEKNKQTTSPSPFSKNEKGRRSGQQRRKRVK